MTSELGQAGPRAEKQPPPKRAKAKRRKKAIPGPFAISLAQIVLFWERLWPALLPTLAVIAALLIISLAGLWRLAPGWTHFSILFIALTAIVYFLWRDLSGVRWPSRRRAQERLEEDGALRHAPLQALDDAPFGGEPQSALWRAHIAAMRERARKARLAGIRNVVNARDPYGFRFIALGLVTISAISAGGEWRDRLALGLSPNFTGASDTLIADVWIEPPHYTRSAPIYLARSGAPIENDTRLTAPAGSVLVAQINGRGRPKLSFTTQTEEVAASFDAERAPARAEVKLQSSGVAALQVGARRLAWPITITADRAPAVAFTQPPARTDDARLAFAVSIDDDFGVSSGNLILRIDPDQERPLDAPPFDTAALNERRIIALEEVTGASGERAVLLDLQSDPWSGLQVVARVEVTDGAGGRGVSEEAIVTLPERPFFNPLAKSVIEQRRTLSVASENWRQAGRAFDALTLAPEIFYSDASTDYLLLRTAFWRVMRQNGDDFSDAVERFWPLALQLEDKALELARQRLEAAREALRAALESGASQAEIDRLVEELRQAMNDYLQALAQSGQRMAESSGGGSQQIEQSQLDRMLDSIRDLSESGADNAARQMLSDLENLLDNMRLSQGGQGSGGDDSNAQGSPGGQDGQGAGGPAGQAGDLIGRQRELADESFARGQQPGATGGDLAGDENAIGGALDDLIDELQGGEADPDGTASRALGRARNEMRAAEDALRNDNFDAATSAMERAIENLREGAENLAQEQLRQARRGQDGQGEGQGGRDPLGRPTGQDGRGVEVPEETDAGRTRAIIDELRRRLGEQGRTEEEIEYLERLLERF